MVLQGVIDLINVMLIDKNRLFLEAVQSLIDQEEDIQVIGMVTKGKAAIELMDEKQPDIVLLDLHLPQIDGIKVTHYIKEKYPETKVIFLTSETNEEMLMKGIASGADGFLLKNCDSESFIRSIRETYRGEVVISGIPARILANRVLQLIYDRKVLLKEKLLINDIRLTKRELDIAYLLIRNATNKEIAQELYLSEGTVKNYVSELYRKFNMKRRADLVSYLRDLYCPPQ